MNFAIEHPVILLSIAAALIAQAWWVLSRPPRPSADVIPFPNGRGEEL